MESGLMKLQDFSRRVKDDSVSDLMFDWQAAAVKLLDVLYIYPYNNVTQALWMTGTIDIQVRRKKKANNELAVVMLLQYFVDSSFHTLATYLMF